MRSWTVPKDGNSPEQNDDAAHTEPLPTAASGAGEWLIAVADGATEAVYSGLWARTLVEAVESDWPTLSDSELSARLDQVRRSFSPVSPGERIPWYVRNKFMAQGSQATLLAVTVGSTAEADELTVRAVSVGDCCLLLFRGNGETCAFPVQASEDFGTHPDLVGNRPQTSLAYRRWEARLRPGDCLLACTDAVGKWILQCMESNQTGLLFAALLGLLAPVTSEPAVKPGANQQTMPEPAPSPSLDFAQFVERYRVPESRPRMRNDDATLVVCFPVRGVGNDQHPEVLETLRKYEADAAQRSLTPISTV